MESAACNVIYVDRAVSRDRHIEARAGGGDVGSLERESTLIAHNVNLLLEAFEKVYICSTGGACLLEWLKLHEDTVVDLKPTLIVFETPCQEPISGRVPSRPPSAHSQLGIDDSENQEEELYGLALLRKIKSESVARGVSKLVLPVALVSFPQSAQSDGQNGAAKDMPGLTNGTTMGTAMSATNKTMLQLSLHMGAADMIPSPIIKGSLNSLISHAFHAHQNAARERKAIMQASRGRRRSWIGIGDEGNPPITQKMVSDLLTTVCEQSQRVDSIFRPVLSFPHHKRIEIKSAVFNWHFNAHKFTEHDDLILVALVIFEHALSMPELEKYRIPTDQLYGFLLACRGAYHFQVPYHNFCHVVDVLQATFHFLVSSGSLPPLSPTKNTTPPRSALAERVQPFHALTLLITAIGHDVGHPGFNNGFLTTVKAPLAQVYSDRSVLEQFHCAAYGQILRQHWPQTFYDNNMRKLMISSILSTDMSLHNRYMDKLKDLPKLLLESTVSELDSPDKVQKEKELAELACALLIKCADISNVAREHNTAIRWMHTLSDETTAQRKVENEMNVQSSIFAKPGQDTLTLTTNQLFFMDFFATPLFQGVAALIPALQYCVDEIFVNHRLFEETKKAAELQQPKQDALSAELSSDCASTTADFAVSSSLAHSAKATADRSSSSESDPKSVNGINTSFNVGEEIFGTNPPLSQCPTKHRCSENTEGSSIPYVGDWASQATSATTGKMPLSPSTQGTSIVSRESLDPTNSTPAPESITTGPESAKSQAELKVEHLRVDQEESCLNGHANRTARGAELGSDPNKKLKKRPSRFAAGLRDMFRSSKHKTASPPLPAADLAT